MGDDDKVSVLEIILSIAVSIATSVIVVLLATK